jgi:hypothetical protein
VAELCRRSEDNGLHKLKTKVTGWGPTEGIVTEKKANHGLYRRQHQQQEEEEEEY